MAITPQAAARRQSSMLGGGAESMMISRRRSSPDRKFEIGSEFESWRRRLGPDIFGYRNWQCRRSTCFQPECVEVVRWRVRILDLQTSAVRTRMAVQA